MDETLTIPFFSAVPAFYFFTPVMQTEEARKMQEGTEVQVTGL